MGNPEVFRTVRLQGEPLDMANELIADFKTRGLRASFTSIVNASIPLMHQGMISRDFKMWTNAQIADQRAHAAGTSIATILITLCRAQVSMSGCQLGYHPEVDCIGIRLDCIGDTLVDLQGADPATVANVVTNQLRERGYLQGDDGAQFVDMDQLLHQKSRDSISR